MELAEGRSDHARPPDGVRDCVGVQQRANGGVSETSGSHALYRSPVTCLGSCLVSSLMESLISGLCDILLSLQYASCPTSLQSMQNEPRRLNPFPYRLLFNDFFPSTVFISHLISCGICRERDREPEVVPGQRELHMSRSRHASTCTSFRLLLQLPPPPHARGD